MVVVLGRLFGSPPPPAEPVPPPVVTPDRGRPRSPGPPLPAMSAPAPAAGTERWLAALERLVRAESPSDDPAAIERCAGLVAELLAVEVPGGLTEILPGSDGCGPHLRWRRGSGGPAVLLLGHLDTVWGHGAFSPLFERREGWASGPGVFDMKGGVVIAIAALAARHAAGWPRGRVTLLLTSDEEVGSETSRALIEAEARTHQAVLVLEPALGQSVKVGRKGVGSFRLTVTGRAAHAGLEPERGVNAVEEMARQIPRVAALADPARGTTVTAAVLHAGTRTNVVPAQATLDIDVRVRTAAEAERVAAGLAALAPVDPRAGLAVSGGLNRPPMEAEQAAPLFALAAAVAAELGRSPLTGVEVGGGSDGNFTAALGIPTLDGLGAVGGNAHADGEWMDTGRLPERVALLAGCLDRLLAPGA